MTQERDIFKCDVCGQVMEVLYKGSDKIICCGQPMKKLTANTQEASVEKHVPVIEETKTGVLVKVGSVAHPMEEKHYIVLIEVLTANQVLRAELKPGQKPEAEFCVKKSDILEVREYCNLHGLWKS